MAKSYNSIKAGWTNSDIDSTTGKTKAKKKKSYDEIKAADYDFGVNQEYIDSFVADSQKYMNDVRSNSKDVNYGNAQSRFSSFRDTSYGLSDRADTIRAYYNANKSKLDDDTYSSMMKYLDSFTKGSDEAMSFYRKNADYYSQWKTEEEYNKAMEEYKTGGFGNPEAPTTEQTVNARKNKYEENKSRIQEIDDILTGKKLVVTPRDKKERDKWESKLQAEKNSLEAENREYERLQKKNDEYYDLRNNSDFEVESSKNRDTDNSGYDEKAQYYDTLVSGGIDNFVYDPQTGKNYPVDVFGNKYESADEYNAKVAALKNELNSVDKLGLYLSYDEDAKASLNQENYDRSLSGMSMYGLVAAEGTHGRWDRLTKDEIDTYYYIFNTKGQNAAYQYISDIEPSLNYRQSVKDYERRQQVYDEANVLEKIALNIATVPANVIGSTAAFADDVLHTVSGEPIDSNNYAHSWKSFSDNYRGITSQAIENATNGVNLFGFSVGDLYQAGMSGADSVVGAAIFGKGYSVIMGMGAAAAESERLSAAGASDSQVFFGGLLAGVAETVFEHLSLDNFIKMKDSALKRRAFINILKQSGIEASEEVFTEIANQITNGIVMGSQSDFNIAVREYVASGKSQAEAEALAVVDQIQNVYKAGLGGFASGADMGAFGQAVGAYFNSNDTYTNGKTIVDNGNVQNLVDIAKGLSERGSMYSDVDTKTISKLASQIETAIKNGGEFSKSDINKIGKLYDLVYKGRQSIAVESDANTVYNHILDELQNRQDIKFKEQTARLLTNAVLDRMSATEKINFDKIGGKDILDGIFADTKLQSSASADRMLFERVADLLNKNADTATGNINSDVSQYTEQPAQTANTPLSLAPSETVRENAQGFGQDISAPRVEETPTATTQDNTDRERSAEALNYALEDIDNKHISKAATDLIKAEYDGTLSAADYVAGMEEGFNFGYSQVPEDGLTDYNGPFGQLSAMQKKHSYNLGVLAREEETRKRDTGVQAKIKDAAEKSSGKNKDITFGRKTGTVKGEGVTIADLKKTFNDTQNKAYKILSTTAEITGVDIVLYKSETDENGNFTGAQGKFKYSEDKLYIDINAGLLNEMDASELGSYVMVRTFCHEFVHFIEKWNVKGYNELRSLTFQTLQSRGINVDAEIRNTMDKLALDDYDKASREVVAETFTDVLPDSKFAQNIAEKNPGLFKKILEKLKEFLENVKSYFRSLGKNGSRVANAMKEEVNGQIRYIQNIVDVFDKVAEQAVENYQRTFAVNDTAEADAPKITETVQSNTKAIKEETSNVRRNLGIQGQEGSGETIRSDNGGAVSTSDADGQGTSRLLEEVQKEDVQGNGGRGDAAAAADKRGRTPERLGDGTDAADRTRGSGGNSEVGDIRRDDVVTEAEEKEKKESIKKVVDEQIEQKSTQTPKGRNFVIGESLSLPQGEKARFRANVEAIKLVKKLEAENRFATPAEQEVLSKYVGWGGLSNAFGEMRWNSTTRKSEMTPKNGWTDEFAEFRKLVDDGVISEDEYKAASASTKNAHYTSVEVIKAMYDGLENLGFKGGRMLEPSSGVGNFVGAMPVSMSSKVNSWTMVELDSITGLIAKYLYPNADVRIQGFEKANLPNNYMDVAIGNVPFGNYGVVDNAYPKRVTKAIHNYFFAKTLDKVRPGGVVMFITSSFTMNGKDNAIRQYIMDRADLLGAIRLPNNAFSGNAGTQVVTDILILKKRESGTAYGGEQFLNTSWQKFEENGYDGYDLNEYFINHPEMVLGTPAKIRGMYGANSLTYNPLDGGSLGEQIKNAFKNITGKMDYSKPVSANAANFRAAREEKKPKKNGFTNVDGKLFKNTDGVLEEVKDGNTAKRITGLLGIRDAYRTLINYIQQGQAKNLVAKARKDLNDVYDKFVKENGYINAPKNKSAIKDDPDSFSIYSLENYDAERKKATKADIFVKDTIKPNRTVTHVDDVATGIIVSVNTVGGIDTALIAKLTGKGEQDVVRELIDNRMAFKTQDGSLETPEKYLSGNVRAKLREAEALAPIDKDFENNVEELKKVVPKDIPFNDIYVTPGSPWIPTDVYADFVAYMLGGYNTASEYRAPDVEVGRSNQTGAFKIVVNNKHLKQGYKNTQKWGTKRKTFLDIIGAMMSSRSITVNDTIETEDGRKKSVINKVETAAAQEKAEEITREFQDWIWKDEARKNALTALYNNTYNALVNPKYDGSHLAVNGLNASFSLREHQANAVQRIITSGGNTLLAHKVGAGKTLEMAAAAMKLKELGIIKKPMFVVPKSLVAQWGVEFKKYFPASKLLVTDEKDFVKANRKTFANRIANGDYDAVILSYEQFEKIPMSKDFQKKFYQEQIDEIVSAIAEEKAETGGRGLTVKEMEKKKSQLEKKQAELTRKEKDEDNIDFEQLGIDSLFVDEAHNFKNLAYVTNMNNVSGLGRTDGSQRAFDLYTKVRYMQGLNGGRGIVFATATPVMNSMAEMYIMQKYLQSDMLNQLGLSTFDAWAKQFGEIVNSVEIKPSGQGFRVKQTFSNFKNLNELQLLFRSFSDVLTQVQGLKIPKMKGGKVKTVLCEPGQFQKDYMAELEKRADNVKNVDPSVDNMLKITSDGRKVAYTQRMIDPSLPYEAGCKIYKCCDNIIKEYKDSSAIKGTQIVFCDMATPKGTDKKKAALADETEADVTELDTESAKLYDDMKAYLIKHGIPASEIAFIHDAKTDQKKKQLFEDVNNGNVRVLIGSTGKMGVGMNAQKRIVAIHHLDAPWRPGDVEQRDGRAFRQGNINEEVSKYVYVTEGSFDARLWDILDRKQHFINQIMNGDNVGRTAEDTGDVTLSAAEVKALASGNPLIMEQVQLSNELQKLEDLQRAHKSSVLTAQTKSLEDKQRILQAQKTIENITADIKARVDTYTDGKFSMTVDKKTFTDKKEAGVSLLAEITTKALTDKYVSVGKFAGFDLFAMKDGVEYSGIIKGQSSYKFNVYMSNTTQMINKICSVVSELDERLNAWKERLSELKTDLAAQEKMAVEPFAKQEELDKKRARFNEVMEILNPPEEQQIADDEDDVQYQQRTDTLTDRRVLEIAASELDTSDLTEGEIFALNTFKKRLENIRDLQAQRKEQGSLYKEQQFGSKSDRSEAVKTLNRMNILDEQIKRESAELLSVEEKEVLKRVLQRSRKVIEKKDREETKQLLRRQSEKRKEAEAVRKYRQRIKLDVSDISSWITNPNNKTSVNRVPDILKNSVIPFLTSIDLTSKRQLRGGAATRADREFADRLEKMQEALKTNGEVNGLYSGYNDLPPDFTERLQSFVNAVHTLTQGENDGYVINRMTGEQLKELSKIVRTLKKFIKEMNVFHYNAVFSHVTDAAESTITELRSIKNAGIAQNGVTNWGFWQNMRPAYAFERFGEGGKAIYDEFRRAQATLAFNAKEIIEFAESTYTRTEVKAWEKEYKEFNLDGDTVRIPVSYIMSLYKLYDDPDGRRHILGEGARVAAHKEGVIRKEQDSGHKLSEEDVKQIIGTLTDRQKAVADALQEFMATQGAAWGNYVSVKRFGEEIFTNPKYFPISSDGRYIEAAAAEHPNEASLYALLNMSFTKKRNENADNRIVLFSIFDVFANHMASMAQYNAFALPVLDALKWYNYRQVSVDEETGAKTVTGSVRDEMARAYGVSVEKNKTIKGYAEKFVENIIKAYNGTEARGDDSETPLLKMLNKYNRSKVGANLKVTFMQPLAYIRAAAEMKYRSLATGLTALVPKITPSVKSETEEMYKYSGIAVWKSLGFFDINISRGLTEIIKHDSSLVDEVVEKSMYGAEKADEITWSLMWKASKAEVKKKQPYLNPGSAEFFSEVNRVFEDTIYKTQVVDSVLTKSEFMRKKNFIARMGSSFMAEPVTTMSMVMSAYEQVYEDMRKGMKFKDVVWKNRKRIVNATFLYVLSALAAAVLQAFGAMWRDEDDERDFGERFWNEFVENFFDELAPWNKLPWVSNVIEYVKWGLYKAGISESYEYKPKTMIEDIVDSVAKAWRIFKGEEKGYEFYAGVSYMLEAVSDISGLPLAAATREVVAIWNNTIGSLNSDLKVRKYEGSENNVNAECFVKSMDREFYSEWLEDEKDRIRKDREEQGKTDYSDEQLEDEAKKKVKSAISGVLKKSYIEAFNNGDDETMSKIQKQMLDMDIYGTEDEIAKLCRKWVEDYDPNSNKALKSGINEAIEQGDFKTVSSLVNELRDAGMSDTSIKSAITSYWKPIYIEAYENNDEVTKAKIRKGLYYTGLWKAQKNKPLSDVINEKCNEWVKEYKQNQ